MLALGLLGVAAPAAAHHISGFVYCDQDGSKTITVGDVALTGITVSATPAGGSGATGVGGTYFIGLPSVTANYTVALTAGVPSGASVLLPAGGTQVVNIVTGGLEDADGISFLLKDCTACSAANCNDSNPCTDDVCGANGCTHSNNTAACSDGDACTQDDACSAGACTGKIKPCSDGNQCTADLCDPATGCVFVNTTKPCNDGNACTISDTCAAGVCNGTPRVCNDNNGCTNDGCSQQTGCVFTNNTTPCDDGDTCTNNDVCNAGKCAPGTPRDCNDNNPCTTDTCSAAGCVHTPNTAPCNDNSLCTKDDVCSNGVCHGSTINCNDNNPCTDDSCKIDSGCTYAFNSGPCDDRNACTNNEKCTNGACVGTATPGVCDDANPCTTDSCDPTSGCVHTGVVCDDGDLCNGMESCNPQTGQCVSTGSSATPAFLFCSEARINNRATIDGDVGVNAVGGSLKIARDGTAANGTTVTAHDLTLGNNTTVDDVKANGVFLARGAAIHGARMTPTLPITTPCCDIPAATCGGNDVRVQKGEHHAPLAPGTYSSLTMMNNGTLTLMPGAYTFCDVVVAKNAKITSMGAVVVNVDGDFRLGNGSTLGPKVANPLPALNVAGSGFRLGAGAQLVAITKAPHAEGHFGRSASVVGRMCLDSAVTDKGIALSCRLR